MIREPFAATAVQIVVTHAIAAGRGVDETMIPGVDRDVADSATLLKQHEVAYRKGMSRRLNCDSRAGHLTRRSRQIHSLLRIDVLDEARTIEP